MPYCDTVQSYQHLHTVLTFLLILFPPGLVSSLFTRDFQTQMLYEFLVALAHSSSLQFLTLLILVAL
jgi:hypothetical protein